MRNGELLLRWQRFGLGLALNISALAAVGYRLLSQLMYPELFALAVADSVAIVLNLYWLILLWSNAQRLEFWNDNLAEQERANKIEGSITIFSSERYRQMYPREPIGISGDLQLIAIACILLWLAYLGANLEMLVKAGH